MPARAGAAAARPHRGGEAPAALARALESSRAAAKAAGACSAAALGYLEVARARIDPREQRRVSASKSGQGIDRHAVLPGGVAQREQALLDLRSTVSPSPSRLRSAVSSAASASPTSTSALAERRGPGSSSSAPGRRCARGGARRAQPFQGPVVAAHRGQRLVERLATASRGSSAVCRRAASSSSSPAAAPDRRARARGGVDSPPRAGPWPSCSREQCRAPARPRASRHALPAPRQPGPRARRTRPGCARCACGLSSPRCSSWPCTSTSRSPSWRSRPCRRRHVVDEGAAAAVSGHDPAQDQLALERDAVLSSSRACAARLGRLELRDDRALLGAGADQARSPRPPRARPRASRMIDLPAPVSPVSTDRPARRRARAARSARCRGSRGFQHRRARPVGGAAVRTRG